jgi:predicted ester cyclase
MLAANKAVVRSFFEQVFNQGRLDLIEELFAPDYTGAGFAGHGPSGPASVRRAVMAYRWAFPDIHFTVNTLTAEGDDVVVHVTWRGAHQGDFMGFAPTGRVVEVSGAELARLRPAPEASGSPRIVAAVWHVFDGLSLVRQLGASLTHHP